MLTELKYSLKDDICFKYIFSKEDVLKDFLNSFFAYIGYSKEVIKVRVTSNKEMIGNKRRNKVFYGDVIAYLNTG